MDFLVKTIEDINNNDTIIDKKRVGIQINRTVHAELCTVQTSLDKMGIPATHWQILYAGVKALKETNPTDITYLTNKVEELKKEKQLVLDMLHKANFKLQKMKNDSRKD